jgi:type I restriction enzyme S subunit
MATETKNTKAFYNTEIPSDWTTPEFGDVFNFLKTFSFSREQLTSEPTNDGIRNIHYGDIHATYENEILDLNIEKTVPYLLDGLIDPKSFDDESFPALKEGDLIIADASEDYEGVCDCVELKNINGAKVVSGLHTFAARTSKEKIALGYRTYALQHEQVIRELRRIATGTSVYGVSKTNISKVKIPLPPLPEQKAIAQVLSTADSAIHSTEKLIAQKELRKKWLMQQLLTGKKRLKGFSGEWKKERLEKFLVKHDEKSTVNNQYPVLTSSRRGIFLQSDYYTRDVASEDNTGYNVVPRGYFTYRHMSDDLIFKFNINDIVDRGIVSTLYPVFTTKDINSYFLLVKLNEGSEFKMHAEEQKQGGSRTYVYFKTLCQLKLNLPSIEEQTAIAQVLQAADKEINLLKAKAEKLREQKKGLMQQLLTGKVRLKIKE